MPIDTLLPTSDLERIEAAVQDAESGTSGEIVPYIVARSDDYGEAPWKAAALALLVGVLLTGLSHAWRETWGPWPWLFDTLIVAGLGALGWLAGCFIPFLTCLLIGGHELDLRVRRRAAVAFIEAEVFRTQARIGILLLVSLFERRVVLLGDRGINERVAPERWKGIVDRITRGLKEDRLVSALVDGIEALGELLRQSGLEAGPNDRDELPDRPRTGGEKR